MIIIIINLAALSVNCFTVGRGFLFFFFLIKPIVSHNITDKDLRSQLSVHFS